VFYICMSWPTVTRKSLQSGVENFFASEARRLWVHGASGSGTRTVLTQGLRTRKQPFAVFDFGICQENAINDKILRSKLLDEIIPQVASFQGDKRRLFQALLSDLPSLKDQLLELQNFLLKDDSNARFRPRFKLTSPSRAKLRHAQAAQEIWDACTSDMSDIEILNLVASLDQERALEYVLQAASHLEGSFVFYEIHDLFRSPFMEHGQELFQTLDKYAKKAAFHTTDSLTFISCRGEAETITVDEWPEELARSVTSRMIKDLNDEEWKSIYAGVGGHAAHLHKAVEGIISGTKVSELKEKMKLSQSKQVTINPELMSEMQRDDTLFSLRDVSQLERYMRAEHIEHMRKELGIIDWQIQQFEANPSIQKETMEQKVQLYEGIRYICSKPYLPVREDFNICHAHVSTLLDANLLVVKLGPSRVQVGNELTRHALIAHCTNVYEELSTTDKLEYNLHVWKSHKDLIYGLNHLTEYR